MRSSALDVRLKHVAVCVDSSGSYGRGLLHGIAEYIDTYRSWSTLVHVQAIGPFGRAWPKHWRGDGILVYSQDLALPRALRRCGLPAVELYGHPQSPGLAQVGNDETAIGRLAAEHLIERRLTQFAFCGYRGARWCQMRCAAFTEAARRAGTVHAGFFGPRPKTPAESENNRRRLVEWIRGLAKPVGIMACSDFQAQRLLDACQEAGVVVPEEAAVIGSSNDEEICLLSTPPLTSVQENPRRIGHEAAALLDRLMNHPASVPVIEPILIPPVGVVTRRSTDVTATTDRLIAGATRLIYEQACKGLTVKQLLQALSVSRSEFYRRFQNVVGRSPHDQILHVRLERVKSLLVQTSFTIDKIAELSGFEHREYLSVAFKREVGLSPGEFRRHSGPSR